MGEQILIVGNDPVQRQTTITSLSDDCYEFCFADDVRDIILVARHNHPAVVIINIPYEKPDFYLLLNTLKTAREENNLKYAKIFLIMPTNMIVDYFSVESELCENDTKLVNSVSSYERLKALNSLAIYIRIELRNYVKIGNLRKQMTLEMERRAQNYISAPPRDRIVLVSNNSEKNRKLATGLQQRIGHDVIPISTGDLVPWLSTNTAGVFCIKMDDDDDAMQLTALIKRLRSRESFTDAHVVVIFPRSRYREVYEAFEMGVDCLILDENFRSCNLTKTLDILAPDIAAEWLTHFTYSQMKRVIDEQLKRAVYDDLTGLYNRRHAFSYIDDALCHYDPLFSLFMIDIDCFKNINDTYGHGVGDEVLRETANRIKELCPPDGLVARYGGEEFLLAFSGISSAKSKKIAQEICDNIAAIPFVINNGQTQIKVTISVGVVFLDHLKNTMEANTIISLADNALYGSKNNGKNRVTFTMTPAMFGDDENIIPFDSSKKCALH